MMSRALPASRVSWAAWQSLPGWLIRLMACTSVGCGVKGAGGLGPRWCVDAGPGSRQDRDEPRTGTLLLGQAGPGPAGEEAGLAAGRQIVLRTAPDQGCQPIIGPGPP